MTATPSSLASFPRLVRLWRERRGNIALLSALLMPVFMGAAGLGVEASNWSVQLTRLQRTADVAAIGAGVAYSATASSLTAARAAADVAELNGIAAGTRTWTSATKTLTDGTAMTVQQVTGIRSSSDVAFKVTVEGSVSLAFAKLFVSATSYTLPASAVSELVPTTSAQPCIVALGTTSTAISISGTTTITANGCSARSDGGVSLSGSSSITAAAVYAASNITTTGTAAVHATKYPNDGIIPDPYANNTTLQNALKQLGTCSTCTAVSLSHVDNKTISPGTYSSISVIGASTLTLNPGLYVVNGPITVGNSAAMSGSGVTIVASGAASFGGDGTLNLTAPGTSPVGSAVPGVVFAGTSTSTTTFGNSATPKLTGVIYYPKGNLTISGAVSYGSTTSCLEFIGNTLTLSGSASFSSSCSLLGALTFGSINSSTSALVQ
jgi:Flp pilus assembly protein TadG